MYFIFLLLAAYSSLLHLVSPVFSWLLGFFFHRLAACSRRFESVKTFSSFSQAVPACSDIHPASYKVFQVFLASSRLFIIVQRRFSVFNTVPARSVEYKFYYSGFTLFETFLSSSSLAVWARSSYLCSSRVFSQFVRGCCSRSFQAFRARCGLFRFFPAPCSLFQAVRACSSLFEAILGCSTLFHFVPACFRLFRLIFLFFSFCCGLFQDILFLLQVVSACSSLFEAVSVCSRLFDLLPGCCSLFRLHSPCSKVLRVVSTCSRLFQLFPRLSNLFHAVLGCYMQFHYFSSFFQLAWVSSRFFRLLLAVHAWYK